MPAEQPINLQIDTLSAEWYDRDIIMLHACFQLLVDCIEKELLLSGHIDWAADETTKEAKHELETLYQWWKERSSSEADGLINFLKEQQYEQDDEMLVRLIRVRKYLWT